MNTNTTMIQRKYVSKRDDCRDSAEKLLSSANNLSVNANDKNSVLATIFSECMFKQGWAVASPKRVGAKPTTPPPTPSDSPTPPPQEPATFDPARKPVNDPNYNYQPPTLQEYNYVSPERVAPQPIPEPAFGAVSPSQSDIPVLIMESQL